MLLKFYAALFGSVVNFTEGLATRVTPSDAWETFSGSHVQSLQRLWSKKSAADERAQKAAAAGDKHETIKQSLGRAPRLAAAFWAASFSTASSPRSSWWASATHWVMGFLAGVLGILFYVLGPLALVFSIPRASDLAGRWFRMFVTILSWPIFSGLILSIGLSVGSQGMALQGARTAFASVVTAVLLIATAVVTPWLAAAMVGGPIKNIAQQGLDAATGRLRSAYRVVASGWSSAASETARSINVIHRAEGGGLDSQGAPLY